MFAFFNLGVEEFIILGMMAVMALGGIVFALWLAGVFNKKKDRDGD